MSKQSHADWHRQRLALAKSDPEAARTFAPPKEGELTEVAVEVAADADTTLEEGE